MKIRSEITSPAVSIVVSGVCFEILNSFTNEATCCGFDSLVVNGAVRLDSMEELKEYASDYLFDAIMRLLNFEAQEACDDWQKEKVKLSAYLRGL